MQLNRKSLLIGLGAVTQVVNFDYSAITLFISAVIMSYLSIIWAMISQWTCYWLSDMSKWRLWSIRGVYINSPVQEWSHYTYKLQYVEFQNLNTNLSYTKRGCSLLMHAIFEKVKEIYDRSSYFIFTMLEQWPLSYIELVHWLGLQNTALVCNQLVENYLNT